MEQANPHTRDEHLNEAFYATKPTGSTVFLRTFLPWQLWRFVEINLRMIRIIRKSHRGDH
jgi:hypothetical protein